MLKVKEVSKSYPRQGNPLGRNRRPILTNVTFELKEGACVGLIGESGSGKSTLARLIMGLEKPDQGNITLEGQPIKTWKKKNPGQLSVVFQDYVSSVNPRFTLKEIVTEPLMLKDHRNNVKSKAVHLLDRVGLPARLLNRYPHEVSGGQLQRACIARAISTTPRFIILDEAISSLDVSVQAQILALLKELRDDLKLSYLFIAHDLEAVASICDEVLFLYKGSIEEKCLITELAGTNNPYAKKLLAAVMDFKL